MDYDILPFTPDRKVIVDAGYLGAGRHIIYGLVEADVTGPRQIIRRREAAGEDLSFTAFLAASLARAIAPQPGSARPAHPLVQAYRDWRGRLVIHHDVDVVVMVEASAGRVAIPHIIRGAQRRSIGEISAEIRAVQTNPKPAGKSDQLQRLAPHLPRFIRLWFFQAVKRNPNWFKQLQGTTIITSLGMFAPGTGWGITFLPVHTFGLTVGSITEKPVAHQGQVIVREILHLTLAFDHDIIDGAPAARFARSLLEVIESGEALEG
jgi:pyruvate/2-oxoglutarate dehydrogenase complex dihydrolipoamide acyltransferase (E2) component